MSFPKQIWMVGAGWSRCLCFGHQREKHLYSCIPLFSVSSVFRSQRDGGNVLPRLAQQIIVLLLCKFLSWFSTHSTAEVTDEAHISITYLVKLHSVLPVVLKDCIWICCCEPIHIMNKVATVLPITQTFLYFLCSESETGFFYIQGICSFVFVLLVLVWKGFGQIHHKEIKLSILGMTWCFVFCFLLIEGFIKQLGCRVWQQIISFSIDLN